MNLTTFEKLKIERQKRIERSSREERVDQATKLMAELDKYGKKHFPLAPHRWEELERVCEQ